jgi:hypothetical protein
MNHEYGEGYRLVPEGDSPTGQKRPELGPRQRANQAPLAFG